jgi:hypothetical protein
LGAVYIMDIDAIRKELGQMGMEVKIVFPMSHNLSFGQEFGQNEEERASNNG